MEKRPTMFKFNLINYVHKISTKIKATQAHLFKTDIFV